MTVPMTAPATTRLVITTPGIYADVPEADYHRDPVKGGSLSASGAKLLLPPNGCPAKFDYKRFRPEEPKDVFDLGKAAHYMVLGVGAAPVELDFKDRRTNAYKDAAADARAAGRIPLLPEQMAQVQDMALAITDHPDAAALLAPGTGQPEASLFWRERFYWQNKAVPPVTYRRQIWRRARFDWLSHQRLKDGRLVIPDYKTARSAEPNQFMKAVDEHGYHMSAAWYQDAARGVGLVAPDEDVACLFVVQEKDPPYVVSVIELPPDALQWGRDLNTEAMIKYADSERTGRWGGYADSIVMPELPKYAHYRYKEIVGE